VQAAEPGGQPIGHWPGRPRDEPARGLVRLVTRLVVAQALAATAIGLPFSRRQLSSILITLAMVAALCALAVLARNGTRTAWRILVTGEAAFVIYGLSRFFFARYLGGTLFAIITAGTLLHPAVARAFGVAPVRSGGQAGGEASPAAGEAFGGQIVG
jgi:hypothetical protein